MSHALRIDLDPDDVGRGLGQLVIAVLEVVRELLERQAVRRLDAGDLTADEIERVGRGLQQVAVHLAELRTALAERPTVQRKESS